MKVEMKAGMEAEMEVEIKAGTEMEAEKRRI